MPRENYTSYRNKLIRNLLFGVAQKCSITQCRQKAKEDLVRIKEAGEITLEQYDKLYQMIDGSIVMEDLEGKLYLTYKSRTRAVYNPVTRATSVTWAGSQ